MDCLDDDSVLAFLDGDLDETQRADIESHLSECPPCADLVATGAGGDPEAFARHSLGDALTESGTFAQGATVGRYVILDLVGRGGMGEVYAAYDPQLDRKIALKLLRDTSGPGGKARRAQERLLREAQAIARLSHPNVVVVYDAGAIDDGNRGIRVYLAMEFIDGQTLAAWLKAKPRPWQEVRDAFLAAGEGLAAAHEAGVVHRDFKPQNVMVARDGTIRVMDFGLASDASQLSPGDEPELDWARSVTASTSQTRALTGTGALVGTPLYMAPEQFLRQATDARTDQFSFCVALYEALFGERPFASDDFATLMGDVVAGRLRQAPQKIPVPAFLRRILARGLQADPERRFGSMRDLLAAMRADPARRRRLLSVGAAVAAAALLAVFGIQLVATRGAEMCLGAADELAGIWEQDTGGKRRTAIHGAFSATGLPYAEDTWTRASALLDDYSRRWSAVYTDNCEATQVRGDQSPEVMDLRMTCLEEGRRGLRAVGDVFSRADGTTLAQAVNAVHALPTLERCSDIPALRAVTPLPASAEARARVAELEGRLAEMKALTDTGRWSERAQRVGSLLDEARAVGYPPLLSEVLEEQARAKGDLGDYEECRRPSEDALFAGLAAHRDDLAAQAASVLVWADDWLGRREEASHWDTLAGALVRRLGPGHELIAAWYHQDRAFLLDDLGDPDGAMAAIELALSLKRRVLPPNHPDIARSLKDVALLNARQGNGQNALLAIDEALQIDRNAYGVSSPLLWSAFDDRGEALEVLHRYQEAESDLRTSIALANTFYGNAHRYVGHPLTALGRVLLAQGKVREAITTLEPALRLRERSEPNSELVAETRFALARAYRAAGRDPGAALTLALAARAAYQQIPGRRTQAAEVDAWLADR